MKKTPWIWAATLLAASLAAQAQTAPRRTYIVQLADAPAAAYTGQVAGLAATKPAPGRRFDSRAAAVQSYLSYLNSRQSAVLATVPAAAVKYRYRTAFNGFAALLTDAEAAALSQSAGVLAVNREQRFRPSTSTTGNFLGLTAPGGLYSQGVKGDEVIIGIVDTGITPEHTAFSDKVDGNGAPVQSHLAGTQAYNPITNTRTWGGICQTGPGFPASSCNNKLIGARFYRAGFDASGAVAVPEEFNSPRDGDSHGSHTASTAGGNAGARGQFANGQPVTITGMAPRARIAAYKACWTAVDPDQTGCYEADTVASIDQAVADGVDVINYSIGGSRTNYLSAVQVAFLFAADAGVFVAASAGNEGPGNTVAHPSPWLTTVAASTHDRDLVATVTLGDGSTYTGASLQTSGLPNTTVVRAQDVGVMPAAQLNATQLTALTRCFNSNDLADASLLGSAAGPNAALDPAKVAGKVVVCDRGSNNRVNKSDAVRAAGGVGMVQVNTSAAQTLDADLHTVPTVHLASSARTAVRAYAASGTGTARFTPSFSNPNVVAPVMAGFSSRGPSLASPNILKPDITAPGVSVLAAIAPVGVTPEQIAAGNYPLPVTGPISGTSMASPHVAGLAALLRSAHRDWSPAAIKSALLTTATTNVKLADGTPDTSRFGFGAGHVNPNAAVSPGLVYDAGTADYFAFLCGLGLLSPSGSTCNAVGLLPAWNLNLPTITSDVVGIQTLRRTVTNVGNATTTYTASASIPGFQVSVSPATLELAPGASRSYTVTALRTNAPIGTWAFGNVDWTSGGQTVRSPLTLRGLSLSVQGEVTDARVRANKSLTLLTGFDGAMSTTASNMVPALRTPGTVGFVGEASRNCAATIDVPAGAQALRVALFDAETTGLGRDDLDLVLYLGDTVVASSGSATSNEQMTLRNPAAGTYTVCVDGFGTSRAGATSSSYVLSSWVVGNGLGLPNTLRVTAPTQVQTAGTGTAVLMWSVPAGRRYLGAVTYANGNGARLGSTLVSIDNQSALPLAPSPEGAVDAAKMVLKAKR